MFSRARTPIRSATLALILATCAISRAHAQAASVDPPRANAPVVVEQAVPAPQQRQQQPALPVTAEHAPEAAPLAPLEPPAPHSAEPAPVPAIERQPLGPATSGAAPIKATPGAKPAVTTGALRTALSLGGVILLILCAWTIARRVAQRSGGLASQLGPGGGAPSGILSVLGRYPVARGQTLVLLKLDRRILLLNQSSAGFRTLCEVTDPDEVASILLKTRDEEGESIAQRFKSILKDAERDPSLGQVDATGVELSPTTPRRARADAAGADPFHPVFDRQSAPPAPSGRTAVGALRERLGAMRGEGG